VKLTIHHLVPRLKNERSISTPTIHLHAWRGTQLKHRDTFTNYIKQSPSWEVVTRPWSVWLATFGILATTSLKPELKTTKPVSGVCLPLTAISSKLAVVQSAQE